MNFFSSWSGRMGIFVFSAATILIIIRVLAEYIPRLFIFLKSVFCSVIEAVANNQDVKKFISKHWIFFRFIRRRLDRDRFSGLPLTLLSLPFLYIVFLFLGVIEGVIKSDAIIMADARAANLLLAFRTAELVQIFTWITLLAKSSIIAGAIVVFSAVLLLVKKRIYILPFWATVAGTGLSVFLGKLITHRPRPDVALYLEDSFSFPSGHAAMAVAFYGFLTYVLFRQIKKWRYKINALFFSAAIILAIGFSRLYLGVHFLSDVWGGYLLGALWLIIGIAVSELLTHNKPVPGSALPRKTKAAVLILILAWIVFYAGFAAVYRPPFASQKAPAAATVNNALDIFNDKNISRFTETITGEKQEPLSFIIVADDDGAFIGDMRKAGWRLADPPSLVSVARMAKAAVLNGEYYSAPMTPSFWDAQAHDFGFEKPTENQTVRARHHARFWRARFQTASGKRIYVGTASQDVGIKWLITHTIKPDIDTERDFLFFDLENAGTVQGFTKEKFVEPTLGKNFFGDQFFTDGEAYVAVLESV
ncbi:MAG: LssY C-terminal domain-containing protein [Candidatus Magasanikbacteria bacterium]|nr:LssY C-terminal domain-containing protein [Candidatus Magasanikbacteria bacterium]